MAMPELPEVETVRLGLVPALEGRRLTRVQARRLDLRFPLPDDFGQALTGRRVEAIGRRAKYLLIGLDDGATLVVHLGMSGSFRIYEDAAGAPPPATHDHVIFRTDGGAEIRYHDPRRFGFMLIAPPGGLETLPGLAGLGPEPLGPDFDGPSLERRLAGRTGPVKQALLDQRVVAGIGNIYASEALFRAAVSPKRKAGTIKGKRAARLAAAIAEVLAEAIAAGGASISDHRRTDGEMGYFQHAFKVYGRAGTPCPGCDCDVARTGGIRRLVQGGRATFHCPRKQR